MAQIILYDTTLRDGTQCEGISFSCTDALKIAQTLDKFGVHYIEGGWPGSNPKDAEFFARQDELHLAHAKVTAFGSTRYKYTTCDKDNNIQMLVKSNTPVVAIFGKSWDLHVTQVLETSFEENLNMIAESVKYFKEQGKEVLFDAEHFFDGYKANPEYAIKTLEVAAQHGADCLVLCDTNGGVLPHEIGEITGIIVETFPEHHFGIHAHNDSDVAVANSLAAIQAGARHLQGTMNGYGERVGNANLISVIPNLQIKMGYRCVSDEQLKQLSALSFFVHELANVTPDTHQAFVGDSAFAHKGGIHVSAILKAEESYQHIDPELVGNRKRTLISEQAGRSNIIDKAAEFGVDTNREDAKKLLEQIKQMENQGYTFEGAEASVELMMLRANGDYQPPFEVIDFMTVVEDRRGPGVFSEGTVKVKVGSEIRHTVAEGNGPVDALGHALRKALEPDFPQLKNIHLTDYKVRILDSDSGTASTTRVLIDFHEEGTPHSSWTTVSAHTNIIEASWRALVDGFEYGLKNYHG